MRFFDPSLASDLSDSDSSFFGAYRRLFERIAEEDRAAGVYPGEEDLNGPPPPREAYPSFGYSHTPFVSEKGESTIHQTPVKDFYAVFMNFQTRKSMGWLDQYRLQEAPDRRVKRMMEKENKRAREMGRREYNDTIRALAAFIRKRDPRYKKWQEEQETTRAGPEAEAKRRAYVARMEQERQERADAFQAQTWQIADEPDPIYSDDELYSDEELDDDEDLDGEDEDGDDDAEDGLECFACDKVFRSEAQLANHEQSAKHKKAVKALQKKMKKEAKELGLEGEEESNGGIATPVTDGFKAMGLADRTEEEDEPQRSASASMPTVGKSKKAKKRAKQRMKQGEGLDEGDGDTESPIPSGKASRTSTPFDSLASSAILPASSTASFSAEDWTPEYKPIGERPEGSFDVFGFGSLIWKPPPHVIGSQPGFIKGYTRRFAQHSVDHRGTPPRPGRVVTLISAQDWHSFKDADESPEGDIVWGVTYTIDPLHAKEVREYLDFREKNGYTPQSVDVYGIDQASKEESLIVKDCLVYVGLPENPAFIGPSPLPALAERIFTCEGPSGRNDEYLLNLAMVTRKLSPDSVDSHLFELEKSVLQLQQEAKSGSGRGAELSKEHGKADNDEAAEESQTNGKKSRRAKKDKKPAAERCNVCGQGFDSRSKLFTHVRDEGHALAKGIDPADLDDDDDSRGGRGKGKKGKKGKR